jgi:hypothetical protein
MIRQSVTEACVYGAIILERFAQIPCPPAVKPSLKELRDANGALKAAAAKASVLRKKRDAAQTCIVVADAKLDQDVRALADALVGAGLGTRRQPFEGFASHTPSQLVRLACAKEVRAVRAMCTSIEAVRPPAVVAKAVASCWKRADAVATALGELSGPQMAFEAARGERVIAIVAWQRALDRVKKHAAVAFLDDRATYRALFAAPVAMQAPPSRKRRHDEGTASAGSADRTTRDAHPAPAP